MGQLKTLAELTDLTWYFNDAYRSDDRLRWIYEWPNKNFPHAVPIHIDDLSNIVKCEVRRWIEVHVPGTVIADTVDKSYRVYYSNDRNWDHSYSQSNKWKVFYFEVAEDALAFRLAFSEYIKDITDLHPTTGDTYEKTSYYKTY